MKYFRNVLLCILIPSLFLVICSWALNNINSKLKPLYSYEKVPNNHGIYKEYYDTGILRSYEEYENGKKSGISIFFNRSTDTISFSHYNSGIKAGLSRYFASNGEPVLEEFFVNGYLQNSIILDDSLFHFDYQQFETGKLAFKVGCLECHSAADAFSESQKIDVQYLDQIHLCNMDSLGIENELLGYLTTNANEWKALEYFINKVNKSNISKVKKATMRRKKRRRIAYQ